ncbi:carboxymuconolactone decarboxylase family protein [Parasphingopyxis marina]|uniref:Carboxymuconolactone decarboxylase family protein n=1 Tax=Parasphingopyxis marina TaxID=2761622 RepID=A0A842I235_9SPHN|nr:carboxymuconolactone decarboxylase family protein [Parasphingopyxis marina]MBC2778861.1 carboxymuconolactone decarboxylase family protein [Parasphingopyxis marina]
MKRPSGGRGKQLAGVAPLLDELTQNILYDKVWERSQLSKRDRSLITITCLIALNRQQVQGHMELGLENGLTMEELGEAIAHIAFYAGWPVAVTAARRLTELAEAQDEGEDS